MASVWLNVVFSQSYDTYYSVSTTAEIWFAANVSSSISDVTDEVLESSGLALLLAGAGGFGGLLRRRRRRE